MQVEIYPHPSIFTTLPSATSPFFASNVLTQLLKKAKKEKEKQKKEAERKKEAETKGKRKQQQLRGEEEEKEEEEEVIDDKEEEEEPRVEWSERGIPAFVGTADHKKRTQKPSVSAASLSASARAMLPSLDNFMDEMDDATGIFPLEGLAMTCFDMMFPTEAADLFVEKVRAAVHVDCE